MNEKKIVASAMMYSCGHNSQGERNLEYEELDPWQKMPSSAGLCPKCLNERNVKIITKVGYGKGLQPTVKNDQRPTWQGGNMDRIKIPEGMMQAAKHAFMQSKGVGLDGVEDCIEAAVRWLSENPIVPSDEQIAECANMIAQSIHDSQTWNFDVTYKLFADWQRRMFLAPEPEVPEEIKDLLFSYLEAPGKEFSAAALNQNIMKAYSRGQKTGSQATQEKKSRHDSFKFLRPRGGVR